MAQRVAARTSQRRGLIRVLLVIAAALSLAAAIFHWYYIEEHTLEWWGYGLFFFGAATAQAFYTGALLMWPSRWLYRIGIVGNVGIIAIYIVTRTHGMPMGPDTGMVEEMQPPDLSATGVEAVLVLCLAVLLVLPLVRGPNDTAQRAVEQIPSEPVAIPDGKAQPVEMR